MGIRSYILLTILSAAIILLTTVFSTSINQDLQPLNRPDIINQQYVNIPLTIQENKNEDENFEIKNENKKFQFLQNEMKNSSSFSFSEKNINNLIFNEQQLQDNEINTLLSEIIETGSVCGDSDVDFCELRFIFTKKNTTISFTIPSSSTGDSDWGNGIENILSRHGECLFSTSMSSSGILKITSNQFTNYAICSFQLRKFSIHKEIEIFKNFEKNLKFPSIVYYPELPQVIPIDIHCTQSDSSLPCRSQIIFPTSSLPISIETTSYIEFVSCDWQLDNVDFDPNTWDIIPPRGSDGFIMYCQIVQKKFHLKSDRLISGFSSVAVSLFGNYFSTSLPLDISTIFFTKPVTFNWDTIDCADQNTPTCSLNIESFYTGPPIQLSFDSLPYGASIGSIDCSSSQIGFRYTNYWIIEFPGTHRPWTEGQWVQKDENIWPRQCRIGFLLQFRQIYDYSTTKISLISYKEGQYTVIRSGFDTQLQLTPPTGENVKFSKFPLVFSSLPNCQSDFSEFCTIYIASLYDPISPSNTPRTFSLYIPGLDIDTTLYTPNHYFTSENFSALSISIQVLSLTSDQQSELNLIENQPYFEFTLESSKKDDDFYNDTSKPGVIIFTFPKEPNVSRTFDAGNPVIPVILSYAGASIPINQQPDAEDMFIDLFGQDTTLQTTENDGNNEINENPSQTSGTVRIGFEISYRPPQILTFFDDCRDTSSLYCSIELTRRDNDRYTYFSATSDTPLGETMNVLIEPRFFLTNFREIKPYSFYSEYGRIISPHRTMAIIDWEWFKEDPSDQDQMTAVMKITKGVNTNYHFIVSLFGLNEDLTEVNFITKRTAVSIFTADSFPEFDQDCIEYNTSTCTARYQIYNDLPPFWDVIIHPLPTGTVHHVVTPGTIPPPQALKIPGTLTVSYECENIETHTYTPTTPTPTTDDDEFKIETQSSNIFFDENENNNKNNENNEIFSIQQSSGTPVTIIPKMTFTLEQYKIDPSTGLWHIPTYTTTADQKTVEMPTDVLIVQNRNDFPIWRKDKTKPMICTVLYALANVVSKPRHRLVPFVVHSKIVENYRGESVFVPQFAWTPLILEPTPMCTTQPRKTDISQLCLMKTSFFGSPRFPLNAVWHVTVPTYPIHPLIFTPYGHEFYSEPVRLADRNKPESRAKLLGTLTISYIEQEKPYVGGWAGVRVFNFTSQPGWESKNFVSWIYFENEFPLNPARTWPQVIPQLFPLPNFYAPKTPIELLLNGKDEHVIPLFTIPYQSYGILTTISSNQTKFTQPGNAILTFSWNWNFASTIFDVSFGYKSMVPCIQTTIGIYNDGDHISHEDWLLIQSTTVLPPPTTPAGQPLWLQQVIAAYNAAVIALVNDGKIIDAKLTAGKHPIRVIGLFVPTTDGKSTNFYPNAGLGTYYPYGFIGLQCMTYTPVNKNFPTVTRDVKQTSLATLLVNGQLIVHPDRDSWFYAYHQLPELSQTVTGQIIGLNNPSGSGNDKANIVKNEI